MKTTNQQVISRTLLLLFTSKIGYTLEKKLSVKIIKMKKRLNIKKRVFKEFGIYSSMFHIEKAEPYLFNS